MCFHVQTLAKGHAEQVKRERARLVTEIKQVADKATHAVQKWYDITCKSFKKKILKRNDKFS